MINEPRELVQLHEGFRFFSYLLLLASMYISCLPFFTGQGIWISQLTPLLDKISLLGFISDVYQSKAVCLVFLAITCIGTKAHKDRELTVSVIVRQVVAGIDPVLGEPLLFSIRILLPVWF